MAPIDQPRKPPSVFKNTHQEYYWQLKKLFPNFQQTCVPPSALIKSSSSTDSKHQSVKDTRRGTPQANCLSRGTLPANGTSRGTTPSVNDISRGTPSVNDISRTPSVNGTGRWNPPANDISRGTPSVNVISRGTPSVNVISRGTPSVNVISRGNPSVNVIRRGTLSVNSTNRGTPSAYVTSREVPSVCGTNKGTPPAYDTSRKISSTSSSSSRGTILSSGGTAASRTCSTSCVSHAAGSTFRDTNAPSLAPSSRFTLPQASASNNTLFNLSAAKATTNNSGGMHFSSKPRVVSLSCPAAGTSSGQKSNSSMMGLIPHGAIKYSLAATGDVPQPKRKRIKRKRISSTVVVQKEERVLETMRSPHDTPKALHCSIREVVIPEVTPLSVPAPVVARLSGPSDNTKKKKGWQKLKEKRKARLLGCHKTDPRHPCSLARENQADRIDPCAGLDAEDQQQITNTGASGSSTIGGCMSLANADACLPTRKVTFALDDAGVGNSTDRRKTGVQFSSPCDTKHSSKRTALIRISGLPFTKNRNTPITPKALSNSTIILDCSHTEELFPESVVTKKSIQMSCTSHPNPSSTTKQRVISKPQVKPSENCTVKPRSSLNTLSRTGIHQGVLYGLLTDNKPSTSCENGSPKDPHNLTYPSVKECSSDSPTSSSDGESFDPLATSSQIMRVPSLKRKVETTYFVASKKVKLSCPDRTLRPDVSYLTSLTKSCALPVPFHPKKVHFSAENPGLSVFQAPSSSVENFSSSSGSSSSGPSVISGTPSPVDTARKKVSFVPRFPRSGSGILIENCTGEPQTPLNHTCKGSILNDFEVLETCTSLGKTRTLGAKTHETVIVDLELGSNYATQSGSRTSALCEESVIIISPEAKLTCGHRKTTLAATRACSKKGTSTREDVNNNSDESCELTCGKVPLESNEEESSFSTLDMLCSEELGCSMSRENITSQDVTMSEKSTCLEQSLFVVPHERGILDKPRSKHGFRRIEFLENSIDLAL